MIPNANTVVIMVKFVVDGVEILFMLKNYLNLNHLLLPPSKKNKNLNTFFLVRTKIKRPNKIKGLRPWPAIGRFTKGNAAEAAWQGLRPSGQGSGRALAGLSSWFPASRPSPASLGRARTLLIIGVAYYAKPRFEVRFSPRPPETLLIIR